MIIETFAGLVAYYYSQILHELGHYVIHYMNGYAPTMGYNRLGIPNRVYTFSNNFDSFKLDLATFSGIVAGLLPLFGYLYFFKSVVSTFVFLIFLAIYLYCCGSDFKSFSKKNIIYNQNIINRGVHE